MTLLETIKRAIVIDFETEPIEPRPTYPPTPVGVAIRRPGTPGQYLTGEAMSVAVREIFASDAPLLFHNAAFDLEVATAKLGAQMPAIERVHDTMLMLFLLDPHAPDYQLKSSCERLLKWAPEERDAVVDWLLEHQPVGGIQLSRSRNSDNYAGAWICKAPVDLVAHYAIGDVDRTLALAFYGAKQLDRRVRKTPKGRATLLDAYARELALLPVIMRMESHGVRVDAKALARDLEIYEAQIARIEAWIYSRIGAGINLDSGQDLAQALVAAGLAEPGALGRTATGKLQSNKEAIDRAVSDPQLVAALRWRGAVGTCLETFVRPWLAQATANGGRIYVRWNSTRRERDGGARTGRLSSSPNLQNIPKTFKALFSEHEADPVKREGLPTSPAPDLIDPPRMRRYILPDEGHVLIDRDFASQELRVLGFFEDDRIAAAFAEHPDLDLHQRVADELSITRQQAKTVHFAILYGVGNGRLAELLGCSVDQARDVKWRYFDRYPSVRGLIKDLKIRAKAVLPIRTWGGREYFVEPPKVVDGDVRTFEYKLLNYLIQGSSADLTKQTMIDVSPDLEARGAWLLASVHDELLISCPQAVCDETMAVVRDAMHRDRLAQVPMRSSGKVGPNFGEMREEIL